MMDILVCFLYSEDLENRYDILSFVCASRSLKESTCSGLRIYRTTSKLEGSRQIVFSNHWTLDSSFDCSSKIQR